MTSLNPIDMLRLVLQIASAHLVLMTIGSVPLLLLAAWFYFFQLSEYTLSYRNLQGPPNDHWFYGNLKSIIPAAPMEMHQKWAKEYGPTFRYKFVFSQSRFYTTDTRALAFILSHPDVFQKPNRVRKQLEKTLGNGLLVAEGSAHKRQRKALNPSFSPAAVKRMQDIFLDKAYELREKLSNVIEDESIIASPTPVRPEDKVAGGRKIDMSKYLGQATLDIIGQAGFNYDFQALSQTNNELAEAYRSMFAAGQRLSFMSFLAAFVPGFDMIPTQQQRTVRASQRTIQRIGKRLIEEKKQAVKAAYSDSVEKGSDIGKDLLSILVKANLASDVPADQRMSDEEVLAQITTFMLAGNETSSTALTWILYLLSQHPDVQKRLRDEAAGLDNERPSSDELAALPYLDAVVRESLRLLSPVTSTVREATESIIVPLSIPIRGRDGKMLNSVPLQAGSTVFLPVMPINTSTEHWGPDAAEFNPDRFLFASSEGAKDIPGVWGNLMTFLGGIRSCIGYRFALAEIKVILFVLVKSFEFEELKSKPKIEKKSTVVMRSRIIGEESEGFQMPLMVKPVSG